MRGFPDAAGAPTPHSVGMTVDNSPAPATRPSLSASSPLRDMGPIDYLVIEFPGRRTAHGEGLRLLVRLVDRGIIRILDLVFLRKEPDGRVVRLEPGDVQDDGQSDLLPFMGANSGLLDDDDINSAAAVIQDGSGAALLVYENRWAAPLATTLRREGADLVAIGHIPVQALVAALDAADAATEATSTTSV
jgi:Family of unknown function (DUF6325)